MRKCYSIIALIAVLALGLFAGAALAGNGGGKPPSPPGQGECEHGNSGKPCRDDPQPEKGKDCEEHGPKEGGVNEDHCKGTTPPPPTTTTDTTTEETTTSDTETTPTSTEPPSDVTESDTTTTSATPGSAPTPAPSTTPTSSGLEEQLEEQAKANGAAPQASTPPATPGSTTLPYTGFETWMAVVIGLGLSGIGLALRRWAK